MTPKRVLRPIFSQVEYIKNKNNTLSVSDFVKKIFEAPKDGRLVIAFHGNGTLSFPDEAVTNIRKNSNGKDLDLVSGYYEESEIMTPNNIDFAWIHQITTTDSKVKADTKYFGLPNVIDVVPFTYEEMGLSYDYIAIVVDIEIEDNDKNDKKENNDFDEDSDEDFEFEFEDEDEIESHIIDFTNDAEDKKPNDINNNTKSELKAENRLKDVVDDPNTVNPWADLTWEEEDENGNKVIVGNDFFDIQQKNFLRDLGIDR